MAKKDERPLVKLKSKQGGDKEFSVEEAQNLLRIAAKRGGGEPSDGDWALSESEKFYTYENGKINARANAGEAKGPKE